MNIASLLDDGIARAGRRPALVQGDWSLSYAELGDRVGRLAAGLAGLCLRSMPAKGRLTLILLVGIAGLGAGNAHHHRVVIK